MSADAAIALELQRQQALVAQLWGVDVGAAAVGIESIAVLDTPAITTAHLTLGISAYRNNGLSIAQRALAAAFPTVQALLGHEGFDALAVNCWRAHPPQCGDLGEYGAQLAAYITEQSRGTALAELPYLADCARLDWALHQAERASDTPAFDLTSLHMLQSTDPASLRLELAAGCALIASGYPIVALLDAHASGDFEHAWLLLAAEEGELAWVARSGYRARAVALDAGSAAFCSSCLAGHSLETCLDAAHAAADEGAPFEFGAWLQLAVAGAWLKGFAQLGD